MNEPFFWPSSQGPLMFGICQRPSDQLTCETGVLFCPPFGEERQKAYRSTFLFAQMLAEHNVASMRFDYRGVGDSEGALQDTSISGMVGDTIDACAVAKSKLGVTRLVLLGIRLGAPVAMRAAAELEYVEHCVLWNPIIDGNRYFRELQRTEKMINLSIGAKGEKRPVDTHQNDLTEIDAELLTADMVSQIRSIDLRIESPGASNILITGRSDDKREKADCDTFAMAAIDSACDVICWHEEPGEYWSARSMHDAYFPVPTFTETLRWILG